MANLAGGPSEVDSSEMKAERPRTASTHWRAVEVPKPALGLGRPLQPKHQPISGRSGSSRGLVPNPLVHQGGLLAKRRSIANPLNGSTLRIQPSRRVAPEAQQDRKRPGAGLGLGSNQAAAAARLQPVYAAVGSLPKWKGRQKVAACGEEGGERGRMRLETCRQGVPSLKEIRGHLEDGLLEMGRPKLGLAAPLPAALTTPVTCPEQRALTSPASGVMQASLVSNSA